MGWDVGVYIYIIVAVPVACFRGFSYVFFKFRVLKSHFPSLILVCLSISSSLSYIEPFISSILFSLFYIYLLQFICSTCRTFFFLGFPLSLPFHSPASLSLISLLFLSVSLLTVPGHMHAFPSKSVLQGRASSKSFLI